MQGDYNSEKVTVYVMEGIDGVGSVKDQVTCSFTKGSFDLKIMGLKVRRRFPASTLSGRLHQQLCSHDHRRKRA